MKFVDFLMSVLFAVLFVTVMVLAAFTDKVIQ